MSTNIPALTDAQIREHWVESMYRAVPRSREDIEATYDKWLAERDAKVKAEALREAAVAIEPENGDYGWVISLENRADQIEREAGMK